MITKAPTMGPQDRPYSRTNYEENFGVQIDTALYEYITDGLKQCTLRRSEAADACLFFFIDKKDGKLQPVQDYRPLNVITKKNVAPIPLIPKLVNKLLGAQFFTKLDI